MSSIESYKKALTNLVDGQRRLTSELRRMKSVNEELESETIALRKTSTILKTRVSQFSQFLRSTPSLLLVYKTAEYARLGSDGDITLAETPKITAELAEFFRTVSQMDGSVSASRISRNAVVSPTQSLNATLKTLSPPSDDALSRARSASVASSSFGVDLGEAQPQVTSSSNDAPLPKECSDKAIHASIEVASVSSGKDSPLPVHVRLEAVNVPNMQTATLVDHPCTMPAILMASTEVQCELLPTATSRVLLPSTHPAAPHRPSHFVDRWLPPYLSTLSPALKRDAEDILFQLHTVGLEKDSLSSAEHQGNTAPGSLPSATALVADASALPSSQQGGTHDKMALCVAQLMMTQQQLAVARSSVASMRARLEDVMLKYQKTAAALVLATKCNASASSHGSSSSVIDGWGGEGERTSVRGTPDMFPMLPAIPTPSTPRPPTQSRTGGRDGVSRNSTRQGKERKPFTETVLPTVGVHWEHSAAAASSSAALSSSLLTYFVEDVCSLLRDARTTLFDLDKLHWRLASYNRHVSAATSSISQQNQHSDRSGRHRTTTPQAPLPTHNDVHLHREDAKRNHPFHTCTSPVLARIAEVLTTSLKEGREAPRFLTNTFGGTARTTLSRAGGNRQHQQQQNVWLDSEADGSEVSSMLQHCWQMLVDFLDGQVHHAQTMVFVREPNLDVCIRQSPTLASLVAQATAPDVPKLPKIV
jgi:hypothetical protein